MQSRRRQKIYLNKSLFFTVTSAFIGLIIIGRLFNLQIIQHSHFQNLANAYQSGELEIPAQRGEILITDHHSNEEFPLATNTTLNLLYADPTLIEDPFYIVSTIGPLIFNLEEARAADNERIEELKKTIARELPPEEIEDALKPLSDEELEKQFKQDLEEKISQKIRPQILLGTDIEADLQNKIRALSLSGIEIIEGDLYAYPNQIASKQAAAEKLSQVLDSPASHLAQVLKGQNRYVVLKRKLHPNITDQINELMKNDSDDLLEGLAMKEEYFRYYPEQTLAAQVIGYVNHAGIGQYGIESTFNNLLEGQKGRLQSKRDSIGKLITVGGSDLEEAIDGADIVLTIDRSIQMKVEEVLAEAVNFYQADSGQVIVMDPQDGSILAMANYPTFNPNNFGEVFRTTEINLTEEEKETSLFETNTEGVYDFYINPITLDKYPVFEEIEDDGSQHYYRYENFRGPEVYHNKVVSWPYEPGSVFKTVAMAAGIDSGEITPNTTFNDDGPIGVDFNVYTEEYDFEIKNSENKYFGLVNMSTVLGKSLNTGMTFIAKKLGAALFYDYLEKFGFLQRSDIEFDTESLGRIEYFDNWTESELATHSFGQGMTVNMVQMANAYNTVANGGILMQPHIIKEIRYDDGSVLDTEAQEIRRVLSPETSAQMIQMLTESTEVGVASNAQVDGHFVAGKTGTSQTYKHGRALSGAGTTITSFAGFGPVKNPRFTILVKMDHPRLSEWGAATAAPTFQKIASFLFDYYNIPPDK